MADIYKLQYNGMTLAYPGWNGYVAYEDATKVYTLTLNQQTGGTISADKMSGIAGEIVTLSNARDLGYTFDNYGITGATLTGNQFTFGDSDVTVEPSWTHNVYSVTISQKTGGTVAASPTTGYYGTQVTLSNTPASEYTFGSYSITGATLTSNKFNFVESNVTAAGSFTQKSYTLTLQNDGHGTIAASKTTGHAGDTVTLSNTYNTYYRFNKYTVTGGTINGSTFTFGSQNATAKANFKVNSFTATGTFANYNLAPLGRNTLNYLFYPIVKAKQSNVPASWLTTKTSYAKTISAYSTSYKTTASGSNASAFKPTGTISAYQFSGYLQTCAYSDYDTSRWKSCNYGLWAGGSKRVNGTPTKPTVAKAYFMTTTNGTTNVTGDVFWSGGLTGTRKSDNITICNGVTTNKWHASGILP